MLSLTSTIFFELWCLKNRTGHPASSLLCSVEPKTNVPHAQRQSIPWRRLVCSLGTSSFQAWGLGLFTINIKYSRIFVYYSFWTKLTGDTWRRVLPQNMLQMCPWRVPTDTFILCSSWWSALLQAPLCSAVHGERKLQSCSPSSC